MEQVWRSVTKASISTTTGARSVTDNKTERCKKAFEKRKKRERRFIELEN